MDDPDEPFWQAAYRNAAADAWGPPTTELIALVDRLPTFVPVLDVGCGFEPLAA